MSQEDEKPGQESGEKEPKNESPQGGKTFDEEYVKKLRDEAAGNRKRAQEAEAKVAEYEQAGASEVEKLTAKLTKETERADGAEKKAARLTVALRKGLTETQAKRLIGDTEEDLEKDADELLADFKPEGEGEGEGEPEGEGEGEKKEPRRRPKERLKPGATPSSEPDETDPVKLADTVPRSW